MVAETFIFAGVGDDVGSGVGIPESEDIVGGGSVDQDAEVADRNAVSLSVVKKLIAIGLVPFFGIAGKNEVDFVFDRVKPFVVV